MSVCLFVFIPLRTALKEFLQHSKESRGVLKERAQASKQTSKQESKQASKKASKQASKPESKQARKYASR